MRKLLLYVVLLLTAGCMMLGCDPVGKSFIKTEGILRYYYHFDYQNITILELTEEVETLEIPLEIEGAPVTIIGGSRSGKTYSIQDKKLKKVHLPYSIVALDYSFNNCPLLNELLVENCTEILDCLDIQNFTSTTQKITAYVADFVYDDYNDYYTNHKQNASWLTIKKANTTYWYNYVNSPNQGVYCLDNVSSFEKLRKPIYNPQRKGYAFTGWYQDKDCSKPWNYGSNVVSDKLNLYAGWEKISE